MTISSKQQPNPEAGNGPAPAPGLNAPPQFDPNNPAMADLFNMHNPYMAHAHMHAHMNARGAMPPRVRFTFDSYFLENNNF